MELVSSKSSSNDTCHTWTDIAFAFSLLSFLKEVKVGLQDHHAEATDQFSLNLV
jgi:hypothetical protein